MSHYNYTFSCIQGLYHTLCLFTVWEVMKTTASPSHFYQHNLVEHVFSGTRDRLAATQINKAAGCISHLDPTSYPFCVQDFDALQSITDLFSHRMENFSMTVSGSLCFIYPVLHHILH